MNPNPKYVAMLEKSYKKFKDIDFISLTPQPEPKINVVFKNQGKVKPKIEKPSKIESGNKGRRSKIVYRKPRPFLDHEDAIILKAMSESGNKKIQITKIAKSLNRQYASVEQRIRKLKLTGNPSMKPRKFTLEEDQIIIDAVVEKLIRNKNNTLEDVVKFPTDIIELGPIMKRTHQSVYERWRIVLLNNILSYYRKTLNLDVKAMLINYLADNFVSQISIDWDQVLQHPDFCGKTDNMVKKTFYGLLYKASKELNINKRELTLRQLSDHVMNKELSKTISEKKKKSQMQMINYFEEACSKRGVKDLLL